MEDSHTIISNCAGLEGHSFVAVYDGHGGALCAAYAGENMMRHIMETAEFTAYAESSEKDVAVRAIIFVVDRTRSTVDLNPC